MVKKVAYVLLVVGGLNWLLVGLLKWDIGSLFGGQDAWISRVVYILVGISALMFLKPGFCCNHTNAPTQQM
ncbi:MAG: DUF378 domain-containing protein [Candidatus Paceibacterota bacterium]|jgi:hypothetical protein